MNERALMNEVVAVAKQLGGDYVSAWRQVLHQPVGPKAKAASARTKAFGEAKLSDAQKGIVKLSDNARSAPGSSIGKNRGVREPANPLMVERKPGESERDWILRTGQQIANLGAPANSPGLGQKGKAADSPQAYGEAVGGYAFAALKGELLASEDAKDREITSHVPGLAVKDTSSQRSAALARMKARGESVDPKSADFAERYKVALKEGE
jgi:hypothetical protein